MQFFYVYILQSKLDSEHFYVGSTEDLLTQFNFDRGKSKPRLHSQTKSEPLNLNAISKQLRVGHLQRNDCESSSHATASLGGIRFFTRPALSGVVAVVIGCPCVPIVGFLFDKLSNRFKL